MGEIRLETRIAPRLARTLTYGFAMIAWAEEVRLGRVDLLAGAPFGPESAAVAALVGPEIVGILTFDPHDPDCVRAGLAWVLPDYRRRGILRLMLDELVKWCECQGRRLIEFEAPIQDAAAARALAACGLAAVSQRWRAEVGG